MTDNVSLTGRRKVKPHVTGLARTMNELVAIGAETVGTTAVRLLTLDVMTDLTKKETNRMRIDVREKLLILFCTYARRIRVFRCTSTLGILAFVNRYT